MWNLLEERFEPADADIKPASAASGITGKSGRAILDALLEGELTPEPGAA